MENNEMIERYIYAVTKNLSSAIRKDVADELISIISDMLDERCGEKSPNEQDVRTVLTELGTPGELAEKYNPNSKKCLIGSPYYAKYIFVLKIVLISTAFGMAVAGLITALFNTDAAWYEAALQWIGMIFSGLVYAFAYVTLFFALFYHKGIALDTSKDSLDNLPPVPKNTSVISKWESVIGIAFSVVFAVVFLAAPQIFSTVLAENGSFIPVFNIEAVKSVWYIIISIAIIGIAGECVKLIEGRYTYRLMAVVIAANLITAALSFIWLFNDDIINPEFVAGFSKLFDTDEVFFWGTLSKPQYMLLGVILFGLVLDTATTVYKTIKTNK